MRVFLQIVAFSLQTDGSGRPVLQRKAPLETDGLNHVITASAYIFRAMCYLMTKRLNYF